MSGSGGVSIARTAIRGENRFYNPPPMRRMHQEAQLKQQIREKQRREEEEERRAAATRKVTESKNRVEVCVGSSESSGSGRDGSNLDRFLEHTTPVVPARFLPLRSRWDTYFVLGDLWESFAEWSAYGAGVPLQMHGTDSTVQYYVPYFSGIQVYVDPSKMPRNPVEDSQGLQNHANTLQNAVDLNRITLGNQSSTGSLSSRETEISNPQGQLLFEFLESGPPFGREPFANKVSDLASRFPELMTYRSCDLSPSSWVSVSWYPIYRIPIGPTLQNLDSCFLTFHSLSTSPPQSAVCCCDSNQSIKLPLPTFGLASYKLNVSVWNPNGAQEGQKITYLLQAADKWLKRLQVDHPDYRFFTSKIPQMR